MMHTAHLERSESTKWLSRLTVADGLFLLIVAAAAIMRLVNLGQIPLSPAEAESALAVWQLWQPQPLTAAIGSPTYFTLTALLTQLLGFSDAVMRLVPALFGLGIVWLPWLLRARLGTTGALVASLLLSVSPLLAVTARSAGGDSMALFALLLLVIAMLRYQETANRRWLYPFFAALGLGLASAPLFYSGLATLVIAWLIHSAIGLRLFADGFTRPERDDVRRAALFGGVLLVAISTIFLWDPAGLGAAARLFADWLARFSFQGDLATLLDPFLAAGRYELILLMLGIPALIWAIWRNQPLATFSLYWLVAILALMLLQRGHLANVVLLILPGYLVIGVYANALLVERRDVMSWALAGGLLLLGFLMLVNFARYNRIATFSPQELTSVWIMVFAFAFAAVTIYFVATWNLTAGYQGVLLSLLALFVFYNWGTAWWLGHVAANDPRERWVSVATADDVRLLAGTLGDVSRQTLNANAGLDIFSAVDSPVLRWYLRDFARLQVGDALPAGAQNAVVITPFQSENVALGSDYLGSDFGLIRNGVRPPATGSQTPLLETFRWWLFHETAAEINVERVIVWLRADLAHQEAR